MCSPSKVGQGADGAVKEMGRLSESLRNSADSVDRAGETLAGIVRDAGAVQKGWSTASTEVVRQTAQDHKTLADKFQW